MLQQEVIQEVTGKVKLSGVNEATVQALRKSYPNIHFTYCQDDDVVAANPYREADGFNLYLINARDHCIVFTSDVESATGLVIAEVIDDED